MCFDVLTHCVQHFVVQLDVGELNLSSLLVEIEVVNSDWQSIVVEALDDDLGLDPLFHGVDESVRIQLFLSVF